MFLCPAVEEGKHGPADGNAEHCDYLYIPGLNDEDGDCVVAFCPKANHGGTGRNVLKVCGTVEWMEEAGFKAAVEKTFKEKKIPLESPKPAPEKLPPEDEKKYQKAVKDLSSEEFAARDAARKVLVEAGEAAAKILEEGTKAKDLETQSVCGELMARLKDAKVNGARFDAIRRELGMDEKKDAKKE